MCSTQLENLTNSMNQVNLMKIKRMKAVTTIISEQVQSRNILPKNVFIDDLVNADNYYDHEAYTYIYHDEIRSKLTKARRLVKYFCNSVILMMSCSRMSKSSLERSCIIFWTFKLVGI